MAAAVATLGALDDDGVHHRLAQIGRELITQLNEVLSDSPLTDPPSS
jgi:4-aminobutyrate aminotransferase-like enzyme